MKKEESWIWWEKQTIENVADWKKRSSQKDCMSGIKVTLFENKLLSKYLIYYICELLWEWNNLIWNELGARVNYYSDRDENVSK